MEKKKKTDEPIHQSAGRGCTRRLLKEISSHVKRENNKKKDDQVNFLRKEHHSTSASPIVGARPAGIASPHLSRWTNIKRTSAVYMEKKTLQQTLGVNRIGDAAVEPKKKRNSLAPPLRLQRREFSIRRAVLLRDDRIKILPSAFVMGFLFSPFFFLCEIRETPREKKKDKWRHQVVRNYFQNPSE